MNEQSKPIARIVGVGYATFDILHNIAAKFGDAVRVSVCDAANQALTSDGAELLILVADADPADLAKLTPPTGAAPELFLVMSTRDMPTPLNADSLMVAPLAEIEQSIDAILKIILNIAYIAIDFYDLWETLRHSNNFTVTIAEHRGEGALTRAVAQLREMCPTNYYRRLLLMLFANHDAPIPIYASEISVLPDWTLTLPDETDIRWGIDNDETLPEDTVRLVAISTCTAAPEL